MKTLGHHTCSATNGKEYIKKHAPFLAENQRGSKVQFLGSGYYFWDDNIGMAHRWGELHFKGNYCVLEFELNMPENLFLDLVGNRQHMRTFIKMAESIQTMYKSSAKMNIGEIIELLKKISTDKPEIFPYKIIRAIDLMPKDEQSKWYFAPSKQNYTLLNPRIIICLLEKNSLLLQLREIVHFSGQIK